MAHVDVDDIALEDLPSDGKSGDGHGASKGSTDMPEASLSRDGETPANRSEPSSTTDTPTDVPSDSLTVLPPEGTVSFSGSSSSEVNADISVDAAVFESYPDGGAQAWLQVFYCFCIFFTTLGGIYCWGVFQDALFAEGLAPSSALAFIGSTQATLEAVFAIPISRIVARYGPKRIAIIGGVLSGLGPILAGSCTRSFAGMMITEGIIFGLGQALCFFCAVGLPSTYFLRRRGLATGLVYAGSGVGGAVLAVMANLLIKWVGMPWAFRTLGLAFMAINVWCGYHLKARVPTPGSTPTPRTKAKQRVIDASLFKDIRYTLFFLAGAIVLFPLFVPPFFLPLFCTSVGLTPTSSSLIIAGFNLASACGRICFGFAADGYLGRINSMLLCLFTNAISTLAIWPFANGIGPLALFSIVNGFCAGGFFSLTPGFIYSIVKEEQHPVAFSMIVSAWAPGYFLGSPAAGYILQAFGGPNAGWEAFRPAIFYAGGLGALSAILVAGVRLKDGSGWRVKV